MHADDLGGDADLAIVARGADGQRAAEVAHHAGVAVVICDAVSVAPPGIPRVVFGSLADSESVDFAVPSAIEDGDLAILITALATRCPVSGPPSLIPPSSSEDARLAREIFTVSRAIASTTTLPLAEAAIVTGIEEVLLVDDARCYFYSAATNSVWSELEGRDFAAVRGITAWSALTGVPANLDRAAEHPLWCAELDDPRRRLGPRVLLQPVVGNSGKVHAVLVASRRRGSPFTAREQLKLSMLSARCAPFLEELSIDIIAENVIDAEGRESMYRREAGQSLEAHGPNVKLQTRWVRWLFPSTVFAAAVAATVALSCRLPAYVEGHAVPHSRVEPLVASKSGVVASVDVAAGDLVTMGTRLAQVVGPCRLESGRVAVAAEPPPDGECAVGATVSGTVTTLFIRPGQRIATGELIGFAAPPAAAPVMMVVLPDTRPRDVRTGLSIRIDSGYRSTAIYTVDEVWPQSISATQARRLLDNDEIAISELNTVVLAAPGRSSESGGATLATGGRAFVEIGARTVFETLFSGEAKR